jgi:hypothetical protein
MLFGGLPDPHSRGVPERPPKLAGARRGSAERPYSRVSRPISRVLDGTRETRMRDGHSSGTPVTRRLKQPTRTAGSGHHPEAVLAHGFAPSLFGLAPGGVCHAAAVTVGAVRSYRTFSPLPQPNECRGGMFSVALSLDSHPPDVIRHHLSAEPGLSSPAAFRLRRSGRPTD